LDYIKKWFSAYWTEETSYAPNWNPQNPSFGQCAISSLTIQDILGGTIAKIKLCDGESHYFNVINDNTYDVTEDQFDYKIDYAEYQTVDRLQILANENTRHRYNLFQSSLNKEITKFLPIEEIEHIAIRHPNYVAGKTDKPEVKIFCQTNKKRRPISIVKFHSGQTVYMKWSSGPIVAKAQLVSWHSGEFTDNNINKLRELTIGTNLFGLSEYWAGVSQKGSGYYTVIHLNQEQWMDNLLYPSTRSRGSSWIYLDTILKKLQWLSLDHEPRKSQQKGRQIPSSLRFLVLKRDAFTCQYCGRRAPDVELHIDHKEPWSKVREHRIENLVTACRDCNLGKSDHDL